MIWKKSILEDLGGLDETLDYGEDKDLRGRARDEGYPFVSIDAVKWEEMPDSLSEVFSQGRWYGKSILSFVKKHPEHIDSLAITLFFVSMIPMAVLTLFSLVFTALFLAQLAFIAYIGLEYFRMSGSPYGLLLPIVKGVRSMGIALGILESFFTQDLGKSS